MNKKNRERSEKVLEHVLQYSVRVLTSKYYLKVVHGVYNVNEMAITYATKIVISITT